MNRASEVTGRLERKSARLGTGGGGAAAEAEEGASFDDGSAVGRETCSGGSIGARADAEARAEADSRAFADADTCALAEAIAADSAALSDDLAAVRLRTS